ncbi:MAG TPA: DUF1643 domain-containing protein [Dehalococcoidia bacterium]|nr:DUF1643 domain-containing protein [Dehalococcoidia bacterium]HIK89707.1 DUF1643 domain-containing protein [Dehalococcoidia bacterium]
MNNSPVAAAFGSALLNSARFSECGRFRYLLTREFGGESTCLFVMLNPSTADAVQDDPTIRRCVGFARREGFGRLEVVNVYSFRSASPAVIFAASDPVGGDNDQALADALERADLVVVAWGNNAEFDLARVDVVQAFIEQSGKPVKCFGLTAKGQPRHPLYVRADAEMVAFE